MHKLNEHIRFLDLNDVEVKAAKVAWDLIEPHFPAMLDDFYDHLFDVGLKHLFNNKDVDYIKRSQHKYWARLFSGEFTSAHIRHVESIGKRHHKANVRFSEYVGTYAWLSTRFFDIIAQSTPPAPYRRRALIVAVNKVMYLDMMIATGESGNAGESRSPFADPAHRTDPEPDPGSENIYFID